MEQLKPESIRGIQGRGIVPTKETIRRELLEAYASLPPVEQALVQLCSVIYEPVGAAVLYKRIVR